MIGNRYRSIDPAEIDAFDADGVGGDAVYDTRPRTNVHLRNAELNDGDSLDSAQYPLVIEPKSMEAKQ